MLKLFSSTRFKAREFGYKPRFYDADKEALEKRIKGRQRREQDGERVKYRLRQEFDNYKTADNKRKGVNNTSSIRLLLIIIILGVSSYIVLDNLLPKLMDSWFPEQNQGYEFLEEYDAE
jgi:hypothetical protein